MIQSNEAIEKLCVNTIRILSVDMVQKANSGHPGLPLGAAPMAYVLWQNHLKFNPEDPSWPDRDRFVLSAGHGSALLYSLLHLYGFPVSPEEIKNFRQWGSRTPGHPESFITDGVEATTGPLGQGSANAVGMAVAERYIAGLYNRPDFEVVNHYTYALVSDGDLMEGVSAEASSLAGHLGLGKLIYLYDSNDVSLDGPTSLAFSTEDVGMRYKAYGWQVLEVKNGDEDLDSIDKAINDAKKDTERPSLIIVKTTIGYGCESKQGKSDAHGSPLGIEEVKKLKEFFDWDPEKFFHVPDRAKENFREALTKGKSKYGEWKNLFEKYSQKYPEQVKYWNMSLAGDLPGGWDSEIPEWSSDDSIATRAAGGKVLNALAKKLPWLMGGDADLSSSTKTAITDANSFDGRTGIGRNLHYGVREHAMAAMSNGIAWHGGVRCYASTFFVFSDYMKPSIRLAAMNRLPVIYVFTHDSLGVGEDGPTHQPVEQLMMLRSIPNLAVMRPCDANEAAEAWKWAIEQTSRPVALVFTRQKLPVLDRLETGPAEGVQKGGYILREPGSGTPKGIILATGSEVHIALEAAAMLEAEDIPVRVVSMPCREGFGEMDDEYREHVLPSEIRARVSVEAGITMGWERWVGERGISIGVNKFGSSAPGDEVFRRYGFIPENVYLAMKKLIVELND